MRQGNTSLALLSLAVIVSIFGIAVAALMAPFAAADAMAPVRAGILECQGGKNIGFVVGSVTSLECVFRSEGRRPEPYLATVRRIGVDLGFTEQTKFTWAVNAPNSRLGLGDLAGSYGGGGANGIALTFTPTSDFIAFASNSSGGKTQTMDGKLDLLITFATPVHMTTNIFEDGIWSTTGIGTKDVTGGVVVSEANDIIPTESHGSIFGAENYNASGTWSLFNQVSGFAGAFTTYKVSIDNTLIVEALASATSSSAFLAKQDFTVTFTTDGSTGGGPPTPEPASLGVLALGGVALLARRRKQINRAT